ncbi:YajQ family cyclic di-GMP-binding protein [bacterium]|nr:YajQ family cyclic di-GMP-binding protein [bacterium]
MPSFDIVSTFNIQEVDNAVNITAREVTTRYDLKDQKCTITLNKTDKKIVVEAANEMALKATTDILQNRSINRKLSIKIYDFLSIESAAGLSVRQTINLKEGISKENSKTINTFIKNLKLKVQPQIQGEQLRVTGKKIDDLQLVIEKLKNSNIDIHLDFVNFKK